VKRKRFSVEQIVAVLKQAEIGVPVAELIRQVGITEQTLYTPLASFRQKAGFYLDVERVINRD
jgi:putative transposase